MGSGTLARLVDLSFVRPLSVLGLASFYASAQVLPVDDQPRQSARDVPGCGKVHFPIRCTPVANPSVLDGMLDKIFAENPDHPAHRYRVQLWLGSKPERAATSAATCGMVIWQGISHAPFSHPEWFLAECERLPKAK